MPSRCRRDYSLLFLVALATLPILLSPKLTMAQGDVKSVMIVQNYRNETITMNFAYFFGDYSWSLMERDIPIDGNLTYKITTGIPGCNYLIDWEIDDATLVISNAQGEICRQEVSLCETHEISIAVHNRACQVR